MIDAVVINVDIESVGCSKSHLHGTYTQVV
jgi:hypothetical protein